jgi:AbiV family abortive infection protein
MKQPSRSWPALTDQEIQQGIHACFENADELCAAARVMNRFRFYGVGLALARVRIEELAKVSMLLKMAKTEPSKRDWRAFWHRFRDHESKWIEQFERWCDAKGFGPFQTQLVRGLIRESRAASAKNRGLYVDYRNGWSSPVDFRRRTGVRKESAVKVNESYLAGGSKLEKHLRRAVARLPK